LKILLVEDHVPLASLVRKNLQAEFGFDVDFTPDPMRARTLIQTTRYDAVIVDLLYDGLASEYSRRRASGGISLLRDRQFQISGLAVLHALTPVDRPRAVAWTTGDARRELHLLLAYEEFHIRAFCSKESGNDLTPLVTAIRAASDGRAHRDALLDPYLPPAGQRPLRDLLFGKPLWRGVWRALAVGARSHQEIADMLHYSVKTNRNEVRSMTDALVELNPGMAGQRARSDALVGYAEAHWEFFLDDTVMRLFPAQGMRLDDPT
jgi:DNA-binding NarL/FixJ family response regulator